MRALFDIEADIRSALDNLVVDEDGCIDPESFEKITALQEEKERKLEAVALYYKETLVEIDALKTESKKLSDRARIAENRAEGLKMYLVSSLKGEPLKTARVSVTYRKSTSVDIDEELLPKKYYVRKVEEKPDKKQILEILKSGQRVRGAELIEKQNIQIK